jgi:N-methylhydantoinase B
MDGKVICIASIQCHHGDTGGSAPGGYNVNATEIWAEGARWPALKVVDQGVERRDVLYAMRTNVRLPGFEGDLRSQIGAAQLGARRLGEVVGRYGVETVERSMDFAIDHASQRFRDEVNSWPDGAYEGDAFVDHDPLGHSDIHIHVKITVDGERLTVDFTGTDERDEIQAWSTFGNTRGYVVSQLASLVDPAIPKNEGFFDSIEIVAPEGCVLNPRHPKPVSAGSHHPGTEVGEAVALAMAQVVPERCAPQIYKLGIPIIFAGVHPKSGQRFIDHGGEVYGAWVNAVKGVDGWGSKNAAFGNLWKALAEFNETTYPHILWSRDLMTDTGGPGQWRGGCGSRYVKETRVPASVHTYVVGMRYPMPGVHGGRDGAPNKLTLRVGSGQEVVVQHTAEWVPHEAGERVVYEFGGGGGWGDPLDRDPDAVLDDALDEYVSVDSAWRDYGVVLTGSLEDLTLAVDEDATRARRAELRGRS